MTKTHDNTFGPGGPVVPFLPPGPSSPLNKQTKILIIKIIKVVERNCRSHTSRWQPKTITWRYGTFYLLQLNLICANEMYWNELKWKNERMKIVDGLCQRKFSP